MLILADLPDHALTTRLLEIRTQERGLLVDLLGLLAELDLRRTVLALGYSSLFSFRTDRLGLTKASAFRRTTAARLLARFPIIAEYLADGRPNLTTLVELRDVLDEAHATDILDRAAGRTEEEVKQLVAALWRAYRFAAGAPAGRPRRRRLRQGVRAHNRHEAEQDFGREHIALKSAARYVGKEVEGAPAD